MIYHYKLVETLDPIENPKNDLKSLLNFNKLKTTIKII